MNDEPDIIKELKEAEKLGLFQSKTNSIYDEVEKSEELSENISNQSVGFVEENVENQDFEKMNNSLKISEEIWRSLTENTNDIIMIVDKLGIMQYINKTIPPFTVDETIGKSVYEYTPKEQHDIMRESIDKVFEMGKSDSYEVSSSIPGTGNIWFRTKVIPIKRNNETVQVILISTNITEQKNAEELLKEKIEELERYKDITVGRELRIVELKKEVNKLCKKYGEKIRYRTDYENR